MRMTITGVVLVVALLLSGCSLTKSLKSFSEWRSQRHEQSAVMAQVTRTLTTEYLGDSIAGRVPLPYTVPRPTSFQVEAGGISLDVTISDSTVTYQSIARPVARSTLNYADSSYQNREQSALVNEIRQEEEKKKRTGFPWWMWLLIIVVMLGAAVMKYFKLYPF